jgi:hypothetical protein
LTNYFILTKNEENATNVKFQSFETESFCMKKAPFLELFISSFKEIFPGEFEQAISLNIKKPTK